MNNNTDKLAKFGLEYQIKCISCLLSEKTFLERIYDIVSQEYWDNDAHKWIVDIIIKYFNQYKDLPTMQVFKIKLDDVQSETLKVSVIEQLKMVYQKISDSDVKFIKEEFLEFCKNQTLKAAIIDSVDHLKTGEYDKIKSRVDSAMKAGMERNLGHEYIPDIDKRMSVMSRDCIKTNWNVVDVAMDGGLAKGELGVIAGNPGGGKSWALARIGAEAMREGKNVIHYTLELNEAYVGLRYDACFTGIDFQNIRKNIDIVKAKISDIPGKLFIKYYPIKSVTPLNIKAHTERAMMLGHKIDLIIVDYADILRSALAESGANSYSAMGSIYEELRGVAGELQLPIWTCSQCNRQQANEDIIQGDGLSDSYRKLMTADFVMSLSRKITDKVSQTARFHIIKNRFGPDGMTFPSRMNTGCGDIQLFDEKSSEGMGIIGQMNDGENIVKKLISNKWNKHVTDDE
jgi:replicative DNA helicase